MLLAGTPGLLSNEEHGVPWGLFAEDMLLPAVSSILGKAFGPAVPAPASAAAAADNARIVSVEDADMGNVLGQQDLAFPTQAGLDGSSSTSWGMPGDMHVPPFPAPIMPGGQGSMRMSAGFGHDVPHFNAALGMLVR